MMQHVVIVNHILCIESLSQIEWKSCCSFSCFRWE